MLFQGWGARKVFALWGLVSVVMAVPTGFFPQRATIAALVIAIPIVSILALFARMGGRVFSPQSLSGK